MRVSRLRTRVRNINPRFRPNSIEDCNGRVCGVRVHQWNRTIEGCRGRRKILENVGIVKAIRILKKRVLARGSREIQRGSVLRDTVNMTVMREIDIEGQGFGT